MKFAENIVRNNEKKGLKLNYTKARPKHYSSLTFMINSCYPNFSEVVSPVKKLKIAYAIYTCQHVFNTVLKW